MVNYESNEQILTKLKEETRLSYLKIHFTKEQLNDSMFLIDILKLNREFFSKKVLPKITINNEELLQKCLELSPYAIYYANENYKNDKELMIDLVRKKGDILQFASDDLKNDKELVLEAVKNFGNSLKYASNQLKDDEDVVRTALNILKDNISFINQNDKFIGNTLALSSSSNKVLEYASDRLKNDKEIVLEAIKKDSYALEYASDKLKDDKDVVIAAVEKIGNTIKYASKRLKNDKDVILTALSKYKTDKKLSIAELCYFVDANKYVFGYIDESWKNDKDVIKLLNEQENKQDKNDIDIKSKEDILNSIRENSYNYTKLSEAYKDDKEITLLAVSEDAYLLKDASERLKNDKDVVRTALQKGKPIFDYIGETLKEDSEFIISLIDDSLININYFGASLKKLKKLCKDKLFMMYILKKNGELLEYANKKLKNDKEVVLTALSENAISYIYIGDDIKNDPEIVETALKAPLSEYSNSPLSFMDKKYKDDKYYAKLAIEQIYYAYEEISEELKKDKEIKELTIKKGGSSYFNK